jgi:hypothetical protein
MVIKRCQIEESMHFSRSFLTTDFKTVILSIFRAMIFLKDYLELHSLKAGNLEVLPYFCCVQKIRKDFVSFYLHGGLIRVY